MEKIDSWQNTCLPVPDKVFCFSYKNGECYENIPSKCRDCHKVMCSPPVKFFAIKFNHIVPSLSHLWCRWWRKGESRVQGEGEKVQRGTKQRALAQKDMVQRGMVTRKRSKRSTVSKCTMLSICKLYQLRSTISWCGNIISIDIGGPFYTYVGKVKTSFIWCIDRKLCLFIAPNKKAMNLVPLILQKVSLDLADPRGCWKGVRKKGRGVIW